ncbi:unnamed protein product [Mesocestoides corti]|uniref:SCP domain-containing protein n=1 Tax=Mesocestoides corti TaxID=53468 RepID=A0A0R3UQ85_MESCO|nr:unnamed protein product [Mesocestoides corti]
MYSEELKKLAANWASRCIYDYPDTEPAYEDTEMHKIVSVDRKHTFDEMGRIVLKESSSDQYHDGTQYELGAICSKCPADSKCHRNQCSKMLPSTPQNQLTPTTTISASTTINAVTTLQAAMLSISYCL